MTSKTNKEDAGVGRDVHPSSLLPYPFSPADTGRSSLSKLKLGRRIPPVASGAEGIDC